MMTGWAMTRMIQMLAAQDEVHRIRHVPKPKGLAFPAHILLNLELLFRWRALLCLHQLGPTTICMGVKRTHRFSTTLLDKA
jgi:hypothetical protein